jgi:hypothetical protein
MRWFAGFGPLPGLPTGDVAKRWWAEDPPVSPGPHSILVRARASGSGLFTSADYRQLVPALRLIWGVVFGGRNDERASFQFPTPVKFGGDVGMKDKLKELKKKKVKKKKKGEKEN